MTTYGKYGSELTFENVLPFSDYCVVSGKGGLRSDFWQTVPFDFDADTSAVCRDERSVEAHIIGRLQNC